MLESRLVPLLTLTIVQLVLFQDATAQGCSEQQWCPAAASFCRSNMMIAEQCPCTCNLRFRENTDFRTVVSEPSFNPETPRRRRDVLFLIDESGSVGDTNFNKFIKLTQALVQNFCGAVDISQSGTRVSVVSFDKELHSHVNFNDHSTKTSLISAIGQITYSQRSSKDTCLVDALEFAKNDAFLFPNVGVERVLVLLSDGCGNCRDEDMIPSMLRSLAADMRRQGVAVITFFVGAHEKGCENQISSLNEGSRCTQLFLFEDWLRLDDAIRVFQTSNCRNMWTLSSPCLSGLGSWNDWNALERCSVTCGGGTQKRTRTCSQLGRCIGNANEENECNTQDCPVIPPCSRSCGGGVRSVQNCFQGSCTTLLKNCNTYPCLSGRQEVEYVARMFLQAITSVSFGGAQRGLIQPSRGRGCAEDYIGSDKNIRMIGAECRQNTRFRRQAASSPILKNKRDVLFLIDESVSIGSENFARFKRLIKAIIDRSFCGPIDIGERKTRVGVLTFDSHQHPHIHFGKSYVKSRLLGEVDGMRYNQSTASFTCIEDVLEYANDRFFTFNSGARMNDRDTEQVVVLLSDGCTYCKHSSKSRSLELVAEAFKKKGVPIVSFLVGKQSDECINEMKALVHGFRCLELFVLNNWEQVDIVINQYENLPCQTTWKFAQC